MSILLSHNSSLERLRSVPPQVDTAHTVPDVLPMSQFAKAERMLSERDFRELGLQQRPIHKLVPSSRHANKGDTVCVHRCRLEELPSGLVRQVANGLYCAGPEMTYIQMAGETSLIGAVVLGHEFCGTYSHFAQMISGFYERPPLTSVSHLEEAVVTLCDMHGAAAARTALRWVRDGSASPMETVVSCMLTMPNDLGGFGFVLPKLNHKVKLNAAEARIAGTDEPRIDTAYPSSLVGVEFDGLDYHRDAEHDRMRREALAHKGWAIYVLNVDELTTYSKLKEKVALLDKIPRRRGQGMPSDRDARYLLKRLLAATRCGVGINAALFGTDVPRGKIKVHL